MGSTSRTWRRSLLAAASAVSLMVVVAPMPAQAGNSKGDDKGKGVMDSKELRKAVKANGVMKHLKELQKIADRNGGTRASGTPGYDRSIEYAEKEFRKAGYQVTRQPFEFTTFRSNSPSQVQRTAPAPAGDLAHVIMSYSGSADVTAAASVPTGDQTGCAPSDFGPANVGTDRPDQSGGLPVRR